MIVNKPALDYLRLGSWDTNLSYYWIALVQQIASAENVSAESKRFLQYQGQGCPWAFAGVAEQGEQGRLHTLLQISGERAHTYHREAKALAGNTGGGKCTRIDVQVTIPLISWDPIEWCETLERGEWGHKPPKPRVILGDDGLDTLYIGGRSSSRYIRFYVKEDADGNRYLRFEVEYKQEKAQHVWERVGTPDYLSRLLGGELDRLPLWKQGSQYQAFTKVLMPGRPVPALQKAPGGKTWEWLHEAVDPVIRRFLADHERGGAMRELLREWTEYGEALDESS